MEKSKILQRIQELDRDARLDSLVNFSQAALEYHLELLVRGASQSANAPSQTAESAPLAISTRSAA